MIVRYLSLLALLLLSTACMELPEGPEAWDTVYYVPVETAENDGDNWDGPKISEAMISESGVVTLYWQRLGAADDVARVIVEGSDASSSYRPVFEAEEYVRKAELEPEQFGIGQRYRVRVEMKGGETLLGRPRPLFPRYVGNDHTYRRGNSLVFGWDSYSVPDEYEMRIYTRRPSANEFEHVVTLDPNVDIYEHPIEEQEEGIWDVRFDLYYIGDGWETIAYQYFSDMNWLITE